MDNNDNKQFTVVTTEKKKDKAHYNFGKSVLIPFFSGIIGAGIVVGTCFGVPTIKNKIIGETNNSSLKSDNTINMDTINTNLISLSDFSDTL